MAGAALIGGGYYAWHEHEAKKTEEEVSFFPTVLSISIFYSLTYLPRPRNKPSRGVRRIGTRTLVCVLKSSATAVLVLPPPGFSSTDATRFQSQP